MMMRCLNIKIMVKCISNEGQHKVRFSSIALGQGDQWPLLGSNCSTQSRGRIIRTCQKCANFAGERASGHLLGTSKENLLGYSNFALG